MNLKTFFSASLTIAGLALSGCVTTHQTKGFQTNPSFKTSKGFPHSFSKNKESNGVQKFFSSLVGKNSGNKMPLNQDGIPLDSDATSLHSKGTLSAELLISLGKMGMEKGRYDASATYFERALQLDPGNVDATAGLAEAMAKRGNIQKSQPNDEAFRSNQPGGTNLLNPLGMKKNRSNSNSEIQLVAYEEIEEDLSDAGVEPNRISLESVGIPQAPVEMVMHPEIQFGKRSMQRVANPFFGTNLTIDPSSSTGTRIIEKSAPGKLTIVQKASRKISRKLSDD